MQLSCFAPFLSGFSKSGNHILSISDPGISVSRIFHQSNPLNFCILLHSREKPLCLSIKLIMNKNMTMKMLPNTEAKYTYHRHEKLTSKLQSESNNLSPTAPCRFLLSKGKNGKKRNLATDTVTVPAQEHDPSSDRIMIQYPKGSTYKLRKEYLLPIIQEERQIVVAPETDMYRRLSWVHTLQEDAFVEIGCDFGLTSGHVVCESKLGIDKSKTSLGIAKNNFPSDRFLEEDVLENTQEEMEDILERYKLRACDVEGGLVIAIDINGNRELEAVEECLDRVLKWWKPRLVIVKSRSLYSKLVEMGI